MTRLLAIAAATGVFAFAGAASACEWHKTTAGLAYDNMARAEPAQTTGATTSGAVASKIIGNGSPAMMSRPSVDATLVSDPIVSDPRQ